MYEFPPFRLDAVNQCLWSHVLAGDDERIQLTPKAFAILQYLVNNANRLVPHRELIDVAWSDTFNVTSAALELIKPIPTIKNAIKAGLSTAKRAAKIGPEVLRIARDLV